MTVTESKGLKMGTRVYWRGDPLIAMSSPTRTGPQSRSPGTMGTWPAYTTEICAKLSERR